MHWLGHGCLGHATGRPTRVKSLWKSVAGLGSTGVATYLVGAREVACVRGVQKTPEAARMALAMGRKSGNRVHAAKPPEGSGGGSKWQVWQDFGIPQSRLSLLKSGGREGIRTPGLLVANEALSQLSYSPTWVTV